MNSMKEVIAEVTALKIVVTILARRSAEDKAFVRQVRRLLERTGNTLDTDEVEHVEKAVKEIIKG